jgi:hypothetical protein
VLRPTPDAMSHFTTVHVRHRRGKLQRFWRISTKNRVFFGPAARSTRHWSLHKSKRQKRLQISAASVFGTRKYLPALRLGPRRDQSLRGILGRGDGFDDLGNVVGTHAAIDHLPFEVHFRATTMN